MLLCLLGTLFVLWHRLSCPDPPTPLLTHHAPSRLPHQTAEPDLQPIFEPFGPLDFVRLQRDATGQATGIGFVQ